MAASEATRRLGFTSGLRDKSALVVAVMLNSPDLVRKSLVEAVLERADAIIAGDGGWNRYRSFLASESTSLVDGKTSLIAVQLPTG
jgi:hypothetical protein